jgi:hypothetical protein
MRWKRACCSLVVAALGFGIAACAPTPQLQATYGEWEAIDAGAPPIDSPDQPSPGRTLAEGDGPAVSLGDLVEMHFRTTSTGNEGRKPGEYDEGRGWIWIAFGGGVKTDFPIGANAFASSLIGLRRGSVHTFVDNPRTRMKGTFGYVHALPFGNAQLYYINKPLARPGDGGYAYSERGPDKDVTRIEITRICHGLAAQRLVTLLDDSPITIAQDAFRTHEIREPRWMYLREAKWEGRCDDGKEASFRYGPIVVEPPAGKTKGLDISALWGPWVKKAWRDTPAGVVLR